MSLFSFPSGWRQKWVLWVSKMLHEISNEIFYLEGSHIGDASHTQYYLTVHHNPHVWLCWEHIFHWWKLRIPLGSFLSCMPVQFDVCDINWVDHSKHIKQNWNFIQSSERISAASHGQPKPRFRTKVVCGFWALTVNKRQLELRISHWLLHPH